MLRNGTRRKNVTGLKYIYNKSSFNNKSECLVRKIKKVFVNIILFTCFDVFPVYQYNFDQY